VEQYMLMLIWVFYLPRCSVLPGVGASETWAAKIVGTRRAHTTPESNKRDMCLPETVVGTTRDMCTL